MIQTKRYWSMLLKHYSKPPFPDSDFQFKKNRNIFYRFKSWYNSYFSNAYSFLTLIVFGVAVVVIYAVSSIGQLSGSVIHSSNDKDYSYYSDYLDKIATPKSDKKVSEKLQDEIKKVGLEILNGKIKIQKHKVVYGDTLSEIAARFSVPMDLIIVASNGKVDRNTVLKVGQTLLIPDRPGLIYRVKKGEVLASILEKYSVAYTSFLRDNPHVNPNLLSYRQTIFLPEAKVPRRARKYNWIRPVYGRTTSRFGWRRHPVFGYRHYHTGVDIAINYGPVRSILGGVIEYTGNKGSYGYVVIVRHNAKFKSLYAHLNQMYVKRGDKVKRGQIIAISGNSGRSTGPHLHFELIRNGRPVNPYRYIRL